MWLARVTALVRQDGGLLFLYLTPSIKPFHQLALPSQRTRVACNLQGDQRQQRNTHTHTEMGSLGPAVSVSMAKANGGTAAVGGQKQQRKPERGTFSCGFQMPLHYPRYRKADYEAMPEWRVDCLLREYGLPVTGDVEEKRSCDRFAQAPVS
ncbi:hypothetical protein VPH35_138536 [Triticum aestivum]